MASCACGSPSLDSRLDGYTEPTQRSGAPRLLDAPDLVCGKVGHPEVVESPFVAQHVHDLPRQIADVLGPGSSILRIVSRSRRGAGTADTSLAVGRNDRVDKLAVRSIPTSKQSRDVCLSSIGKSE